MSSVTIVANVGVGPDTYRLLREPAQHKTSGGIEHFCHIAVCDEVEVDAVIGQIEAEYKVSLTEVEE